MKKNTKLVNDIILLKIDQPHLYQKDIALKLGCSQSNVWYVLKRYKEGKLFPHVPTPELDLVEVSIQVQSNATASRMRLAA